MAAARKTFEVAKFKASVNQRLAVSTCSPEERYAMASVLESVLHETGNYRGFGYLEIEREGVEVKTLGDESRRVYY